MRQYVQERRSERYNLELTPGNLGKVNISWNGCSQIESDVVNCCAFGIRVLIPPLQHINGIAKKNDIVKVYVSSDQILLIGICVYCNKEHDDSVSMGIYFDDSATQNFLSKILSESYNVPPQPPSFVSHEWEELVDRLCNSEDLNLREIGNKEKALIEAKQKHAN